MVSPQIVFQACVCIIVGAYRIITHRGWNDLDLDGMMDQHGSKAIVGFPKPKCLVTFYCGMLWSGTQHLLKQRCASPFVIAPLYWAYSFLNIP